jgi:hypothetical protein
MWRVIWQHNATVMGNVLSASVPDLAEIANLKRTLWSDMDTLGAAEPVFHQPASDLRAWLQNTPDLLNDPAMDLAGYFHIFVPTYQQAMILLGRLKADDSIGYVDIQGRWGRPVIFGETRTRLILDTAIAIAAGVTLPFVAEQGYLGAAPGGVDALFAWTVSGGQGSGVRICDVESGWNLHHEDLLQNDNGVIYGQNDYALKPDGSDTDSHGTAVLGIFHGDKNNFGVTGIAADSIFSGACANYDQQLNKWNAAAAIKFAADHWLRSGDVMLLEMHAPGPHSLKPGDPGYDPESQAGFIPIEYWLPEFSAIKYAVAKGIHVIEAAGNGGEDLDGPDYKSVFSRTVRDSGAVLVGGGNSAYGANPRSRIWWSNFGSRLDVQGWGNDIVTTGGREKADYCDLVNVPDSSKCYTKSFGGTSGASPIVVGVVSSISGALRAAGKPLLSPGAMRALIVATGTAQSDAPDYPSSQQIGPLPNLKAAFQNLRLSVPTS